MTTRMHYQMELAGETATLYVTGALGHDDVETLTSVCAAAPLGARTLRLDLHGLGQLSAEGTDVVRRLLQFWRESRHGEFRLATSHMLATLRDVASPRVSAPPEWRASFMNEALAGTYL
jgi:hypothetical protein